MPVEDKVDQKARVDRSWNELGGRPENDKLELKDERAAKNAQVEGAETRRGRDEGQESLPTDERKIIQFETCRLERVTNVFAADLAEPFAIRKSLKCPTLEAVVEHGKEHGES